MRSGHQNRNAGPELDSNQAASHHDVDTNTAGGSLSMSMNNPQNLSSHQDFISTATSPMFPPSSPMHPASPNTQLTMQLLGNLMQMQLDGGFALPSPSVPVNSNGPTGNDTPNSNSFSLLGSFNMSQGSSNANGGVNMLSSPVNLGSGTGSALPSSALLEQQIKLQQLQQLQQLQNQIFQQQMALISGQTVKTPTLDVNSHQQFQHQSSSDQTTQGSSSYTGLPTPGPSTELRPQQHSIEFVSPMILNNYMEAESPNGNHGQQSHSHTSSPMITSTFQQHHTQDDTFSQGLPPAMASRSSIDFGQVHSSSHHQTQNLHGTHHSHHALHRGIASAPEHLAFDIRSGHEFDLDVSPLTSPWLGAYSTGSSNTNSSSSSLRISTTTDQHRQSAMRGLAGPALNINTNGLDDDRAIAGNPNKRTASPSTDEASPHPARKKHSPAIGPTLSNACGMLPPSSSASRRQSGSHRGSKSTSSTPLLRDTRNRSKSGAGNGGAAGSGNSSAMAGDGTVEHQHQHIFSISGLAHDGGSGSSTGGAGGGIPGIGPLPEDSPSPVDLSVPPSNSAHTENTLPVDVFVPATGGSRLTPVTPASIMNLGRLGMTSSNVGEQGNDGDGDAAPPIVPSTGTTTTRGKGKNRADGASKGLKAILPARDTINGTHATTSVTAENTNGSLPSGPKKTSHKAAEQKRRDSLKTTFDDLRQLLPPIAFEDAIEEEPSKKPIDKVLPVRGPLLPGALPPRGPPKAGGDGPNKGVSKLQLLICGNQYIRTLKGRVDRRDVEIAKLREEVKRLRGKVGVLEGKSVNGDGGGGMQVDGENNDEEDMGEEIDLERDLDAIEGMTVRIGPMVGSTIEEEDEDE